MEAPAERDYSHKRNVGRYGQASPDQDEPVKGRLVSLIETLFARLTLDRSGFTAGINGAITDATQLQGNLNNLATWASSSLTTVGKSLTLGLTVPIAGAGVAVIKTAGEYEAALNILSVAARDSGTSLEELDAAAITIGADTQLVGIDAMEAADAMTTFYKAGLSTTDMFGDLNAYLADGTNLSGALRAAIDLQAASDLDLAASSEAVAIAMATYGLEAADATSISDSFVQAADASIAEVSDLVQAMSTFGPTAATFGWSLEDTNTALALLSERGISGSEAGTALKSMMTNLMRDTNDVNDALTALNVQLYDQNGNMKDLPTIVSDLSLAFQGLTEEETNHYVQTLAGTYGMKAMQTLLTEGVSGWEEMTEAINGAATAQEVATKRTEGFEGAWEQFEGAVQTLEIVAGTPLLENYVTPATQSLTDFVSKLIELDPAQLNTLVGSAARLASIGPAMWITGRAMSTIQRVVAVLGGTGSIMAVGIGVVAGALWNAGEGGLHFQDSLQGLADTFDELGLGNLADKLNGLVENLESVAVFVQNLVIGREDYSDGLLGGIQKFLGYMRTGFLNRQWDEETQSYVPALHTVDSTWANTPLLNLEYSMQTARNTMNNREAIKEQAKADAQAYLDGLADTFGSYGREDFVKLFNTTPESIAAAKEAAQAWADSFSQRMHNYQWQKDYEYMILDEARALGMQ